MTGQTRLIILCGGVGSRLKPISTTEKPKQFLNLFSEKSLLQETITRNNFLSKEPILITNLKYKDLIEHQVKGTSTTILYEEYSRGTFASIILTSLRLNQEDTMFITPADHYISELDHYQKAVKEMIKKSQSANIITLGSSCTHPSTDYGYIRTVNSKFSSFIEKPELDTAKSLIEDKDVYFNTGIFCVKVKHLHSILKEVDSSYFDILKSIHVKKEACNYVLKTKQLETYSFDSFLLERTRSIDFVRAEFKWSDIGTFEELIKKLPKDSPYLKKILKIM